MSSTFIPVDLDQVLDEFEEQEKNHQGLPPINRPDTLDLPNGLQGFKPHSISDPRTYSFNSPLEAMLKEQSNTIDKTPKKSLAEELADLDLGANIEDSDDDDVYDDVDGGSDASSTTAVIAAAEKITSGNNFGLPSNAGCSGINNSKDKNGINLDGSNINASNYEPNERILNEIEEDDTDFLSLFNSVVDKNPFCLEESKQPPFDDTKNDLPSTELLNEITDESSQVESSTNINMLHNLDDIAQGYSDDCEGNYLPVDNGIDNDTQHTATTIDYVSNIDNSNNNNDMHANDSCESLETFESNSILQVTTDNNDMHANVYTCESSETFESNSTLQVATDSKDLHAPHGNDTLLPGLDITTFESNTLSLLNTDNENKDTQSVNINEALPIDSNSEAEPVLIDLNAQQNDNSVKPYDENTSTADILEGGPVLIDLNAQQNDNSVNPNDESLSTDRFKGSEASRGVTNPTEGSEHASSDVQSVDHIETVPSIQNQMISSTVDSSSADSLCGDETSGNDDASSTVPEGERGSPVRGISPEPQLADGILPVHISSGDPEMGFVPPIWVPDEVATHCMTCGLKFNMIKRKHHCRACGRVLCSSCCNMKFPLPYMGNKDARVCQVCCDILLGSQHGSELTEGLTEETAIEEDIPTTSHNIPENVPDDIAIEEGTSTVMETEPMEDPDQVLERLENNDDSHYDELDNSDTIEVGPSDVLPPPVLTLPNDPTLPTNASSASLSSAPLSPALSDDSDLSFRLDVEHVRAMIPQDSSTLPPVLTLKKKAIHIQEHPDRAEIMYRLKGLGDTVIFLLNKNLIVKVKIVKLKCCVKKKCWCFVTDGMGAANQEEMVVLLECEHSENTVPKDVLSHFNTAFTYAKQGHVVSDLGFTIFGQPFLGSSNNAGFLYIKPTFQCLENLPMPTIPYIVGILIQRQEAPWAQLFPIRLMLRLGTMFRYYPCPLWSVRNRESVYHEIGHTIMNLLTDFKNFQYSIPRITGLVIHMEDNKTTVRLPQDRFDEMVKVLNAAEEHMFAFGANFSSEADSHLVCIQEGESYRTQAINIQNKTRKVTGASFVVFTGSLKTSNPNDAKVSIIEDGIMIQMLPDAILELRKALREMQDYVITTGGNPTQNSVTQVNVEWVSRDTNKQTYTSPIDGRPLTDVPSIQVHSSCDFSKRDIYRMRWTNVFLERSGSSSRGLSSRSLTKLTSELSRSCCEALRPYLHGLFEAGLTQLSLRVNVDSDSVEYSIGANQKPLPGNLMADLDSALIPSINAAAMKYRRGPLTVELFFSIISLF